MFNEKNINQERPIEVIPKVSSEDLKRLEGQNEEENNEKKYGNEEQKTNEPGWKKLNIENSFKGFFKNRKN